MNHENQEELKVVERDGRRYFVIPPKDDEERALEDELRRLRPDHMRFWPADLRARHDAEREAGTLLVSDEGPRYLNACLPENIKRGLRAAIEFERNPAQASSFLAGIGGAGATKPKAKKAEEPEAESVVVAPGRKRPDFAEPATAAEAKARIAKVDARMAWLVSERRTLRPRTAKVGQRHVDKWKAEATERYDALGDELRLYRSRRLLLARRAESLKAGAPAKVKPARAVGNLDDLGPEARAEYEDINRLLLAMPEERALAVLPKSSHANWLAEKTAAGIRFSGGFRPSAKNLRKRLAELGG